jgi:hypothetical protein
MMGRPGDREKGENIVWINGFSLDKRQKFYIKIHNKKFMYG